MATGGYSLQPAQVTDLSAITEDVLFRTPTKNKTEVNKAIIMAARDFLSRTGVWKERRTCALVQHGWYGFKHGYLNAKVLRVDSFREGHSFTRMEGAPDSVAPVPCGIPMPIIGTDCMPSLAPFIEQGGYVLVAAPGHGVIPEIPPMGDKGESAVDPIMEGPCCHHEGEVVFTLNIAFGGAQMPSTLIQEYGEAIANGAAHNLLVGPNTARTSYGDRFISECDTVAMRMSLGDPHATLNGTIFDGMVEI